MGLSKGSPIWHNVLAINTLNPDNGGSLARQSVAGSSLSFTAWGGLGRRAVVGCFDGEAINSDGCAMLFNEVEAKTRIIERLAEQFVDHRNPN